MSYIPDAISVVIPTYNRAHLIKASIQSVLDQTLQPYEIIVVDDFSTDNTEEVVNSFNSPLIKYIKNQRKKGANGARNTGILMAKGEFIAFHDSDDIWFFNKLDCQYSVMRKYENIKLCFCSFYQGNETNIVPEKEVSGDFYTLLIKKNFISTQTILIEKKFILDYMFDESIYRFQDWDLVLRIAKLNSSNIMHLNIPLVLQRIDGVRISTEDKLKTLKSFGWFFEKHPEVASSTLENKYIKNKILIYGNNNLGTKIVAFFKIVVYKILGRV